MKDIRHKDGLGFADIRFTNEPEKRHITFFDNIVKSQEETYRSKFFSCLDLLREYSKQLSGEIRHEEREKLFYEFLGEIGFIEKKEFDSWEY